jgi:hypothetical protein
MLRGMPVRGSGSSGERAALLGLWSLGALGCLLGLVVGLSATARPSMAVQALDLVRIVATTALTVVLVLGPGLALRTTRRWRRLQLGFVPLPGVALLVATGCLAWGLSKDVHPRAVCFAVLIPVLGWLLVTILRAGDQRLVSSDEGRALLIVGIVLGVAVARSLWSLGPPGELFGGTTFRTLEVGNRSDSVISFHIVQLVANGHSPFGAVAHSYFGGWTFSDRGPLAGLASAPVVLLSGGRPSVAASGGAWSPFDVDGFMAYRLAMMTLACTAFLPLWTLVRRLGGPRAARFAVLLAATTPFLVHEIWFTWPKLLAASLVLLSAIALIDRRWLLSGMLVGAGYLAHPLALLSAPTLVLIALWPVLGARARHPQFRPALLLLAGLATYLIGWRLINSSHYTQSNFLDYVWASGDKNLFLANVVRGLGGHPAPAPLSAWVADRLVSVGNTLIPFRLPLLSSNQLFASCGGFCTRPSAPIVQFFLQYWMTVPFGLGIVFLPLLIQGLWRAIKRWPWAVVATVIVPFVLFAIYWGGASSGLLREGLHAWVLTIVAVIALEQQCEHFTWLRHSWVRALLALRAVEVLLVAILPTIVTRHRLFQAQFSLTDSVAVLSIVVFCACLAGLVWRERAPPADRPQRSARDLPELVPAADAPERPRPVSPGAQMPAPNDG